MTASIRICCLIAAWLALNACAQTGPSTPDRWEAGGIPQETILPDTPQPALADNTSVVASSESLPASRVKSKSAKAAASTSLIFISWNIANFGKSKSNEELAVVANTVKHADIVAIQEVSSGTTGIVAVQRLVALLNKPYAQVVWVSHISDKTAGYGPERYAFLLKRNVVSLALTPTLMDLPEDYAREPYLIQLKDNAGRTFSVATLHLVPQAKDPSREAYMLANAVCSTSTRPDLICGDFNIWATDPAMRLSLQACGYRNDAPQMRTTLKQKPAIGGERLANAYDHLWYRPENITLSTPAIIPFFESFPSLELARTISDHAPIQATITLRSAPAKPPTPKAKQGKR